MHPRRQSPARTRRRRRIATPALALDRRGRGEWRHRRSATGCPGGSPTICKRFRALTTGHAVIMGRKTWESLGRALPERQNIVVTRQRGFAAPGAETARSLDEALALVRAARRRCSASAAASSTAQRCRGRRRLYLTEIDRDFDGDATVSRRSIAATGARRRAKRRRPRSRAASTTRSSTYERTRELTTAVPFNHTLIAEESAHVRRAFPRPRSARSRSRARGALAAIRSRAASR